ncbi:DUF1566 domain-containing protein [Pseudodesulfovibrio sediminis]|uniref:Lcl C-terminal domain-containing protein n=1 Tax=Pseudodesulfovibrio sediminis TaxID=2810563 RepID=A0ABN6EW98_9BACT|nr:DUF1566 domain-containing protein [Pseudodesulfovibrio sediminis]BCS89306.1 hypothetical protein PSDVSF_25480 [Pseudodesulfovibrio sediminis]
MKKTLLLIIGFVVATGLAVAGVNLKYPIVDTGQNGCFDSRSQRDCPEPGKPFNGQDSQYKGNQPHYKDNGDGTITDLVTGLMWVKERGNPVGWQQGMNGASECRVGGYDDWRAPTIKELYSLIDFNGWVQGDESSSTAYIDTRFFDFKWGDTNKGQRLIDCQDWSATVYTGTTMGDFKTAFGVNFADGRIKGYPVYGQGGRSNRYMRYVRGNPDYGKNDFALGAEDTVVDKATSLIWQQADDGTTRNWEEALAYCEELTLGGRSDWRLPSAKELQSIVDYTRSPTATDSAAIDPIFDVTDIESYYWTSTTHLDGPRPRHAAYVAFGRAMGYFASPRSGGAREFMDVHGAGAQRSDPKAGNSARYPQGHGPQGDDIRIDNSVRCVTGGGVAYYEPSNDPIPSWNRGNQEQRPGRAGHGGGPGMQSGGPGMGGGTPGMSMGQRQGPPQEAYAACNEKEQGDECMVETPHGTVKGICRDTSDGTVCVPKDGRRGGKPM